MIKSKLSYLLAEERSNISSISKKTGISRNSLAALYYDNGKGIHFETLSKLCAYFNCEVGDLLEHVESENRRVENE